MIKNPELLQEAEARLLREQRYKQPLGTRLKILDDMYRYASRFREQHTSPENSSHLQALVHLTDSFRRLKEKQKTHA